MAGIRSKATITGSLPLEAALVKDATGAAIALPVYADCTYDSASGQWICDTPAPAGTYAPGAQLMRLKGSNPAVTAGSLGTVTVAGAGTAPTAPVLGQPTMTSTTATLTWTGTNGTYTLQRAPVTNGTQGTFTTVSPGPGTAKSYSDGPLPFNATYAWRVKVTVGGLDSPYSNVVTAQTTAGQTAYTPQGGDYAYSSISEPNTTSDGVAYTRHSSFAELTAQTTGSYLDALIFSSWHEPKSLQVFVNGTWQQAVQMATKEKATKRILLPGSGQKTVTIRLTGSHRENDADDIWCTDIQQLTSNAPVVVVAPVLPTDERNVVMGDSIQGDGTVNDDLLCSNILVRDSGRHLLIEQYGSRTITLSLGTPQLRDASAKSLVDYVAGATIKRIRGALITNDEGRSFNLNGAATLYGLWFDEMYRLDPSVQYEMELPVYKFQGSANGQERLSMIAARNELVSMAASRPWLKVIHAEYWLADIELYNQDGIHPGNRGHFYMAQYKNDSYNGVPLPTAPVMRPPKLKLTFTPTTGAAGEPRVAHTQIENDPGVDTVDLYFSDFDTGAEYIVGNGTSTAAPYNITFVPVDARGDYFLRGNKPNGFFYSPHEPLSVTPFTKKLEVTPQSGVAGTQRKFHAAIVGGYNVTKVRLWEDALNGSGASPIMTLTSPPWDFFYTPPVSRKYFLGVTAGANNVEGFTDAEQVDVL